MYMITSFLFMPGQFVPSLHLKLMLWTIFVIMILFWVNASVIGLNLPLYVSDVIFSK